MAALLQPCGPSEAAGSYPAAPSRRAARLTQELIQDGPNQGNQTPYHFGKGSPWLGVWMCFMGLSETGRVIGHRMDECRGPLGPRSRPCARALWRGGTFRHARRPACMLGGTAPQPALVYPGGYWRRGTMVPRRLPENCTKWPFGHFMLVLIFYGVIRQAFLLRPI